MKKKFFYMKDKIKCKKERKSRKEEKINLNEILKDESYRLGTFRRNGRGFGFVNVGEEDEIFISPKLTKNALDGDEVLIRIFDDSEFQDDKHKREGKIFQITKHAQDTIVGVYKKSRNFGFVIPDDQAVSGDIYIPKKKSANAKNNQKVVVKIDKYSEGANKAEGTIVEIIGGIDEAGVDMMSLIKEYKLPNEFPENVLAEARAIPQVIDEKNIEKRVDLRNEEKFHRMGEFICKVYMGRNNRFVNFADASPRTNLNPGMVYEYGKFIGNNTMMGFGALKAKESIAKKEMISNGKGASINGFLYTLLSTNEIIEHPAIEPFTRDCFFPDLQVFITRSSPQSDKGLSYAIKGGHNDESHNHNDVGNYIVYADGEPLIIDVGALAYNAKYFSKDRYTFWAVSSDYHNTPIINGFIQKEGIKYAATSVSAQGTKNKGTFTLDLAGAYPVEAAVISWTRKLSLYRQRNILYFSETYILKEYKAPSSIILMTAALVEKKEDGILSLRLNNKNYSLKFNPNQLSAMIEEVEHNDASIKNMWGKVYRIKLQINSQELHNRVTYSLSEIPNNKI